MKLLSGGNQMQRTIMKVILSFITRVMKILLTHSKATEYGSTGIHSVQTRDSLLYYDRTDGITVIEDYTIANGVSVKLPIIIGNDEGLRRQTTISTDAYTHEKLRNGSPYYFGVTAYGYSKNSSPAFLESKPKIVEVIPGRDKIDYSSPYTRGDEVLATQINGMSNADVLFSVVDPTRITGDSYRVKLLMVIMIH